MLWGMGTSSYRLVIIKIQSVRTNQRFEISYNITYRHNNTYRSKKKVRTRKMMKLNFEAAVDYIHEHPEIYLTADKSRASDGYICPICGKGDLISRQWLLEVYGDYIGDNGEPKYHVPLEVVRQNIKDAPSAEAEWIPCSERLPEDSGDYLVCPSDGIIEDYSDCSDVMIMPYDADCEAFGWWTERYDSISLGFVDSDFNEFEVIAWMPLPKPYREDGEA